LTPAPANGSWASDPAVAESRRAAHSFDFHSVNWFGDLYEFSSTQAACVAVLWQAWENRTPFLSGHTVVERAGISAKRLDLVFRGHPAWGAIIVPGRCRGNYRLAEPRP
jgi:hypothetical protein